MSDHFPEPVVRADLVSVASMSTASSPLPFIDLFCGAGGFSLGFAGAGFYPVLAVDTNWNAAQSYRDHFGPCCLVADLRTMNQFPSASVIIGGPPCQGFSVLPGLGRRGRERDDRNNLVFTFADVVASVRPLIFVAENVATIFKLPEGNAFLERTRQLGYRVECEILNAADFGAPQLRKRAIIIGSRICDPRFPDASHVNPNKRDLLNMHLKAWVTVRDAIGDLPRDPDGISDELHAPRMIKAQTLERYRRIPAGGNWHDLPDDLLFKCWKGDRIRGTDLMGRLSWDKPSLTVRTDTRPEKGRYLHPEADRAITLREAARLQGFPDDFKFFGSKHDVAAQIGNAIPIPLANAIAVAVRRMLAESGAS